LITYVRLDIYITFPCLNTKVESVVLQILKVYIWQYGYLLCEKNIHVGKKIKKIIIMEINMGWARSVSDFVGSKKWIRARPFLSIKTRYFSSDQPVTRPTTTQQSNSFSVSSDSDRFGNFCPPLHSLTHKVFCLMEMYWNEWVSLRFYC
jgi:hypothetical protein